MTWAAERPASEPRTPGRLGFLIRPGWLLAAVAAFGFAVLCYTVLAPWQFGRNAERSAQNAAIAASTNSLVEPVENHLPVGVPLDPALQWRPVSATGRFLGEKQVAVGLRQNRASMPAVEVLAPLQLADGTIVLVDRGYLDAADQPTATLPVAPAGTVTVIGRLQPFQPDPSGRGAVQRGARTEVRGIDPGSISDLPGPVRGGFIQLTDGSPGVLDPIGVPQLDAGPFLSYAWQWLVFGTMAVLAFGYFAWREFTDPRTDGSGSASEPGRRRDFDAGELYRQFDAPSR